MNESTIDINETFYVKIGSSGWLQDSLYLYLYIPFGVVCVLLDCLLVNLNDISLFRAHSIGKYAPCCLLISAYCIDGGIPTEIISMTDQ